MGSFTSNGHESTRMRVVFAVEAGAVCPFASTSADPARRAMGAAANAALRAFSCGKRDSVHITGISQRTARGHRLGDNMPPMPRHSRPMPHHNAQESSNRAAGTEVPRGSFRLCVPCAPTANRTEKKAMIRENPLAGLGIALFGVAGGTGKSHVSCFVTGEKPYRPCCRRGRLVPRCAVRERALADRFPFSSRSIRDDLRVLEEEGLIERRRRRESNCAGPKNYCNCTSGEGDHFWSRECSNLILR